MGRGDLHREAWTARSNAVRLSPEIYFLVVSPRCCQVRGPRRADYAWSRRIRSVTPGSENRANDHEGSPGTWETPSSPSKMPEGAPAYQLRDDPRPRVRVRRGRTADASVVSPSEGNEVRRNGRQGVGASPISIEAGERPFRTPWSEGDAVSRTEGRLHAGDTEPRNMYPQGRRIVRGTAKPRRDEPDALIGQVRICGSPGGQSSGATRPKEQFD